MDKEQLINGTIKFVLAFGLTVFLLVKGWMHSYEKVVIAGEPVTFYRVYEVEEAPKENFFFKKRIYNPLEVKAFAEKIDAELFYLSEKMELCAEETASFVAVKVKKNNVQDE